MHDYGQIFDKAGDIAVKLLFCGWMAGLTYWVIASNPQPLDFSILVPLMLTWFGGAAAFLLFGFIPALLVNILFGGLFTGLFALKNKLAK